MANSGDFKRLWTEYNQLKNWANPASSRFKIEKDSFENPTTMPSSASNNPGAASTMQVAYVSIIGLIYPSTEPFGQRGLRVEIQVPVTYPQEPPHIYMRMEMKIRHPNIEINGE